MSASQPERHVATVSEMSCAAILLVYAPAKHLTLLHTLKRLQDSYCEIQCARIFRANSRSTSHAAITTVWSGWQTLGLCLQSKNLRLKMVVMVMGVKRLEDSRFISVAAWELLLS